MVSVQFQNNTSFKDLFQIPNQFCLKVPLKPLNFLHRANSLSLKSRGEKEESKYVCDSALSSSPLIKGHVFFAEKEKAREVYSRAFAEQNITLTSDRSDQSDKTHSTSCRKDSSLCNSSYIESLVGAHQSRRRTLLCSYGVRTPDIHRLLRPDAISAPRRTYRSKQNFLLRHMRCSASHPLHRSDTDPGNHHHSQTSLLHQVFTPSFYPKNSLVARWPLFFAYLYKIKI